MTKQTFGAVVLTLKATGWVLWLCTVNTCLTSCENGSVRGHLVSRVPVVAMLSAAPRIVAQKEDTHCGMQAAKMVPVIRSSSVYGG